MFLIEKRGLYYRPKSAGYTGIKREAGRYTFEEAAVHGGPNGPDGSLDGISIWEEDEAPDFSSACAWDVKLVEKTRQESADTISSLATERDQLRGELEEARDKALEEAAAYMDSEARYWHEKGCDQAAFGCQSDAAAIRALKDRP